MSFVYEETSSPPEQKNFFVLGSEWMDEVERVEEGVVDHRSLEEGL